jgi:hypothetical protein
MTRPGHGVFLVAVLALGCSHMSGIDRRKQEDGSYRVSCKEPLTRCLTAIEEVCGQTGYEIVQAKEDRSSSGPKVLGERELVISEAVARCRQQRPLFGGDQKASQPAAKAAPGVTSSAPQPAPAKGCFPGATQACVGPGACQGGQQCLPDGTAFGPCDCGTAATPASPVSPATP